VAAIEAVEVPVPAVVLDLALLDTVDYADAYRVDAAIERSPEQWMRAFLEGAPRWFQLPWAGLGKSLLGARFGPLRGSGHVLGWRVLQDLPDAFAVGLDSAGGLDARLIALTSPGQTIIATQIRLRTRYARSLWPAIRRGHRYFAPYLLSRAATRATSGSAPQASST
jgi:hypothetical protein